MTFTDEQLNVLRDAIRAEANLAAEIAADGDEWCATARKAADEAWRQLRVVTMAKGVDGGPPEMR